jgi:hypothetical protein
MEISLLDPSRVGEFVAVFQTAHALDQSVWPAAGHPISICW